jgi:hypothetical protein
VGTFGSTLICTTTTDVTPTIQAIRYDWNPEPLDVTTYVHTVPAASARTGPGEWTPVLTRYGTPERYADWPYVGRGDFEAPAGVGVDAICGADERADPYMQVVTVMKVGAAGARFDNLSIDYEYEGSEYTLVVPWTNIACGSQPNLEDWCDGE